MKKIGPMSVLCVVKGQNSAGGLKLLLNGAGINQLFVTDDVNNVFDIIDGAAIDVLLVQDDPPDVDAVEVCRSVRTSPKSPNIKLPVVVILTEHCMTRTVDATVSGVHELLVYPFSGRKLLRRLTAAHQDKREFVQVESYVGPDRRFLRKWDYRGPARRQDDMLELVEEEDDAVWCSGVMKKFSL